MIDSFEGHAPFKTNQAVSAIERGRQAESAVAAYFVERGYALIARNYSVPRLGELDLVMRPPLPVGAASAPGRSSLTVIEVKARSGPESRFGGAAAAITHAKLQRIRNATYHFQQTGHFMNNQIELLAALVHLDKNGLVQNIEIVPIEWQ